MDCVKDDVSNSKDFSVFYHNLFNEPKKITLKNPMFWTRLTTAEK